MRLPDLVLKALAIADLVGKAAVMVEEEALAAEQGVAMAAGGVVAMAAGKPYQVREYEWFWAKWRLVRKWKTCTFHWFPTYHLAELNEYGFKSGP